jgi:membrane protein involved in D-alanine export
LINFYVNLYFFIRVAVAAILFRAAARYSPALVRQLLLFLISLYFVAQLSGSRSFLPALGLYLVAVLAFGRAIAAARGGLKSHLMAWACVSCVLVLVAYKYGGRLGGTGPIGDALSRLRGLAWIGLSYLTFRAIDYVVVIRSRSKPALPGWQDALYGLSFLIFFPAYVSGPIQRYQAYVKDQLQPWRPLTFFRLRDDILRISIGVIKILFLGKWAYANCILTYDLRAGEPSSWLALAVSLYCYYLYFYFDFSGYCDAAIGLADILEVRVPENFHYPFLSTSPQDFWNRWHITLAQWLRDMVFFRSLRSILKRFPRASELPVSMTCIFFTFVLMGAWHGDTWNWVLYGCYHGSALSGELAYRRAMETFCPDAYQRLTESPLYRLLCIVLMFNYVAWGLLLTLPLDTLRHLPSLRSVVPGG